MPKLLFIGIIERTCSGTVVRQIPGIADCFQVKGDGKTDTVTVSFPLSLPAYVPVLICRLLAYNERIKLQRHLEFRGGGREYSGRERNILERHICYPQDVWGRDGTRCDPSRNEWSVWRL